MPYRIRPICVYCARFHHADRSGQTCDAFPAGIPQSVLDSRQDHRQPVVGDHGLQFLADGPDAAAEAAEVIEMAQSARTES